MSNSLVISIEKLDIIKKQLNEYACKIIISKDIFGTGFINPTSRYISFIKCPNYE